MAPNRPAATGSDGPGAAAIGAAVALGIATFDVLLGYAAPLGDAFPALDHARLFPLVALTVFVAYGLGWAVLRGFVVRRFGLEPRAVQLALAAAAFGAFFGIAVLRSGKGLESEPTLAIAAVIGAASGVAVLRFLGRAAARVTLHPRNLLLPLVIAGIVAAGVAGERAGGGSGVVRLGVGIAAGGLLLWTLRSLPTHQVPSRALWLLTPLLFVLLVGGSGWLAWPTDGRTGPATTATPPPGAPRQVLLITVDTLRADAVGSNSTEASMTPHLDAFAARSTSFERAYSRAPWTMPSVASILTGVSPLVHGIENSESLLAADFETLAESMARHGYRTGAFGWNPYLNEHYGFDQGFHEFHVVPRPAQPAPPIGRMIVQVLRPRSLDDELPARELNALALDWIAEQRDQPFFVWLHYFDPHAPYASHPKLMNGRTPPAGLRPRLDWNAGMSILLGTLARTQEEREWIRALYDAEVRYFDRELGDLLEALEERGLYDDALIVLTADHGQEFWDHGAWGHGQSLYQEQIRVPLLIKRPGQREGNVRSEPVVNEGITPTVLSLCSIEHDPKGFTSGSLLAAEPAGARAVQPVLATATHSHERSTAVVDEGLKYVRGLESGREQVFDLTRDPRELHDVAHLHPERVAAFRAEIERQQAASEALRQRYTHGQESTRSLSEVERANLRALGYAE